jgi:hypothetical protein
MVVAALSMAFMALLIWKELGSPKTAVDPPRTATWLLSFLRFPRQG